MNISEYIEQHSDSESPLLAHINRETNVMTLNPHMLSGQVQGRVLSMLSKMIQPKRILELGTFTGYSALCLAEGLAPDGVLDTCEINDELEDFIRQNIASEPRICLHIGDCLQWVDEHQDNEYDLVFIDADKRHYMEYYNAVLPRVRQGGWILADNTLWDGHIIDPAYDHDKQTLGLRAFNDYIAKDQRVEKVIVPLRDGLTIIRKTATLKEQGPLR